MDHYLHTKGEEMKSDLKLPVGSGIGTLGITGGTFNGSQSPMNTPLQV